MAATVMQTVDLVIAGVGIVAVLATVLGVVFYEEAAGAETVSFQEVTNEGAFQEGAQVTQGQTFTFDTPDNATGARFDVEVAFNGQANQGGDVSVNVRLVGPTGNETSQQGTFTIQARGTSGSTTVSISLDWAEPPADIESTERENIDRTRTWDEPIQVIVEITSPNDVGVGPLAPNYSYQVDLDGDAIVYEMAPREIPDPQGAQ